MAIIEGIHIKNFKALKDVKLGKSWQDWQDKTKQALTPLTVIIGKNGAGKTTLFDVFGFLADCLKYDVEKACTLRQRGGFDRLRSLGSNEPIELEIYYKKNKTSNPITYELAIDKDKQGRPHVTKERIRQRRNTMKTGWPFTFCKIENGKGVVWAGNKLGPSEENKELDLFDSKVLKDLPEDNSVRPVNMHSNRELAISTLGALKDHPRIADFRDFIEDWYLSYFHPNAARSLPQAQPDERLNSEGSNLGNFAQFMQRDHPKKFSEILQKMSDKIPGISKIDTLVTEDRRLLLRFNDKGFTDPFYAQQMSDGTLKLFTYLLMLEDPNPPRFICLEEPENGLYLKLMEVLAHECRTHSDKAKGSQILMTTHQPYFVDHLSPEEVWILEKGDDGFSTVRRASDDELVRNMVDEGIPLGSLWYSNYLGI